MSSSQVYLFKEHMISFDTFTIATELGGHGLRSLKSIKYVLLFALLTERDQEPNLHLLSYSKISPAQSARKKNNLNYEGTLEEALR